MAPETDDRRRTGSALRIGVLYLLFGAAWILVTDTVLPGLVEDVRAWETYEGLLFVGFSAALVCGLVYRELSARSRTERELKESERRYRAMFEQNVAGAFRTTLDGEISDCNQALADLLGFDRPEELVGTSAGDHYADVAKREEWIAELREKGRVQNLELHLQRRDGTDVWTLMNAALVADEANEGPRVAGTMVDITQEKQLRDQLEAYAYHDSLTGLPNRRYLKEKATAALSKAHRDGEVVGLLYIDLDRFKRVNDTLGHDVGDQVLHEVGRRFQAHVREEDMAARIGGDEFAVLLNTVEDESGAMSAAHRLREGIGVPYFVGGRSLHLTVRVGIALFPDHGREFHELLSRADEAMLRAQEGNAEVAVHAPTEERRRHRDELADEEDLRRAIEQEHFVLHFQPVYRVAGRRLVGAEGLARWRHPGLGLRSPAEFIPIAERTGLIREIDRWAFRSVTEHAKRFAVDGPLEWLSMNASAQSLGHEGYLEEMIDTLEDSGLDGDTLMVEVTESQAMRTPQTSAALFRQLRDRGVRIGIDDFGTGHSALAYLKNLPIDLVKLDMIFVHGIEASEQEDRLLRALIELGKTLGVRVVAEGVESEGQFERLGEHGCHLAQGYWLGRPMPADELADVLRGAS